MVKKRKAALKELRAGLELSCCSRWTVVGAAAPASK
jgi:hypothetical protein